MSFAEFAARIAPLARPRLTRSLRRSMGPKRRKTKSGFHIGDHVTHAFGEGTVRSIRNWPDYMGRDCFWLYLSNYEVVNAELCRHVEL